MSATENSSGAVDESGGHLIRWLVLVAMAIGLIAAGRRWALSAADKEFADRLRTVDESRD
jgi:hypothetical protein